MQLGAMVSLFVILSGVFFVNRAAEENEFSLIDKGKSVYISEGCVHCHSQFIRPGTLDTERWGFATTIPLDPRDEILIGNRRQGPDLSNVGGRRSREWNKLHLMEPGMLSQGSRMPSYQHLFEGEGAERGELLLDYLESLRSDDLPDWQAQTYLWEPNFVEKANSAELGARSYLRQCAQCHGETGKGDGLVAGVMTRRPRDLASGEFRYAPRSMKDSDRDRRLAQIIKYGQLGTSMPGHEGLTDEEIVALVQYVKELEGGSKKL